MSGRSLWPALVALLAIASGIARASEAPPKPTKLGWYSFTHCGVQCLYAALRLEGRDVSFESLLVPRYVGSPEGSSLAELKQAAIDHGLFAESVRNLTLGDLKRLGQSRALLHVKSNAGAKRYDHWILLVGSDAGTLRWLEPPGRVNSGPPADLAAIWNGTALLLSTDPIDLGAFQRHAWGRLVAFASAVLFLVFLTHRLGLTRWASSNSPLAQISTVLVILAASTGVAVAYHLSAAGGLLRQSDAVAQIRAAHVVDFVPRLSTARARQAHRAGEIFIDARHPPAFASGHIAGAINIPPGTSPERISELLSDSEPARRLIVYCQNASCPYSDTVVTALMRSGRQNVAIYKAGWADWETRAK